MTRSAGLMIGSDALASGAPPDRAMILGVEYGRHLSGEMWFFQIQGVGVFAPMPQSGITTEPLCDSVDRRCISFCEILFYLEWHLACRRCIDTCRVINSTFPKR